MASNATTATRLKYTQLNLQKSRVDQGLSLEKIADSTKISLRFLRAIEDEEFEKLPGGIFNTSYLRQYATAISYDADKLLAFYSRTIEPERSEEVVVRKQTKGILRWFGVQPATGR